MILRKTPFVCCVNEMRKRDKSLLVRHMLHVRFQTVEGARLALSCVFTVTQVRELKKEKKERDLSKIELDRGKREREKGQRWRVCLCVRVYV